MRLGSLSEIQSGHITRGRIVPQDDGAYRLLQARDMDSDSLSYEVGTMVRFDPVKSSKDWILRAGDLLFMARGARNFTVMVKDDLPDDVLAAACFFIIRVNTHQVLPTYLHWYLNQEPVAHYLLQHSGRGVNMPVVKRAVLEGIDVPVPPLETQEKVAYLAMLMQKERVLLHQLAEKRIGLITEACFKAIRKSGSIRTTNE